MTNEVSFRLNSETVTVPIEGSLLDALREVLGDYSVKDGCAPQGQCGACTVLVNGEPRVSCVTAVARVAGTDVTTVDGISPELRDQWVQAFETTAASQCGFCTPGIICRLVGTQQRRGLDDVHIDRAMAAHLCRCTGWQPIKEAIALVRDGGELAPRDPMAAASRASLEQGVPQSAGPDVVLGRAPFSDDTAPLDAQLFWSNGSSDYVAAESKALARTRLGAVQGRNSTLSLVPPVALPEGDFALAVQTVFVDPAYAEPDVSWCEPDGDASSPAANAGAFGAKRNSRIKADATRLANEHRVPVKVVWNREATVRWGKKRPPLAIALHPDGSGIIRVGVTPQSDDLSELLGVVRSVVPEVTIELVEILGPPVGATHRGAILSELLAARAVLGAERGAPVSVTSPNGARASVSFDGVAFSAHVYAGDPLCSTTLRSYVAGSLHQAFSMVTSEGIAINDNGEPVDLTVRSFGVVPSAGTPPMNITIEDSNDTSVAAGGAVFAAALAAVWLWDGGTTWPTRRKETR